MSQSHNSVYAHTPSQAAVFTNLKACNVGIQTFAYPVPL